MRGLRSSEPQVFEAFLKSAQYLLRLQTQQDVWEHLGKFVLTHFPANWVAFVERNDASRLVLRYCTLPEAVAAQNIFTNEVQILAADVLETGFLASRVLLSPAPSMTVFLPIIENYQTSRVMLIGHNDAQPLPKELLSIYLALAGLAGATAERRRAEEEVHRLNAELERRVAERTLQLQTANDELLKEIAERKRAEAALIRTEKLAVTGRLAASMAHEINNPLEAMTNIVYLLGQSVTDADIREYVDILEKQLQTISRIANQTLKFHREIGRPAEFELAGLIGELVDFYQAKAKQHGVTLVTRLDTKAEVVGFSGEIRQVISNLLLNAIEATPQGGRVTLHIYESPERQGDRRRGYRVSIADTGIGIDARHRSRIFEPFFTTKGENGTGLGLWVSLGIINRAGGFMRVWSTRRPGRSGTCFSLFLPAEAPVTGTLERWK